MARRPPRGSVLITLLVMVMAASALAAYALIPLLHEARAQRRAFTLMQADEAARSGEPLARWLIRSEEGRSSQVSLRDDPKAYTSVEVSWEPHGEETVITLAGEAIDRAAELRCVARRVLVLSRDGGDVAGAPDEHGIVAVPSPLRCVGRDPKTLPSWRADAPVVRAKHERAVCERWRPAKDAHR
jgi:hypothetical protein